MKPTRFLFLLAFMALAGCMLTRYSYDELPEPRIYFGDGGGFSGAVTEFVLVENGQLFYTNSLKKDTCELERLRPAEVKNFFLRLDTLRLTKYDFYQPGNLYFFLRQTDPEVDHKITWGMQDAPVRPDIQQFYEDLRAMTANRPMECPEEEVKEPTFW